MGNYIIPIAIIIVAILSAYAFGFAKGEERK